MTAPTTIEEARAEIVRVGTSLFHRGYVHASAGNLSARIGDDYLITPTDAPLGFLDSERIAVVDGAGTQVAGDRASKTFTLHRRIYHAAPTARFIIHTHSTHLVALTLLGVWSEADILPPITPYFVMKVGHVPLVPYHRPGHPAVADHVARLIDAHQQRGVPLGAVMLERLGPVVWGPTPTAAMAVLEELEETARLWLLTQARSTPLTDPTIQDLKDTFNAPW
jgi:ribulose-5-phosphate 4-epimerase/fuculose-1-phosphate aldolase